MTYHVLYQSEIDALANVPCTREQAQQIIDRNTALMNNLLQSPICMEVVNIGCPHCDKEYSCSECDYPKDDVGNYQCVRYKFGGFGLDYHYVDLSWEKAWFKEQIYVGEEDVLTWLQGHIEWGERVLEDNWSGGK